jgi:DNA-binding PadR family transcriptional regulator
MAVQNNIHAKLPIIEAIFFILIRHSKHGYAIMTEVEALSGS